ncbi:Ig-like domain-containing protein [Paenibacillus sp. R14(2021)]|uniref:Ig-like domain-containing protein n=1 Tax=Paenibacillus sp. R14(2021) TaxID=2859228 RepID=UPI0035BE8772
MTIKEANNNPIPGHAVTLSQDSGNSTITAANGGVTDTSGQVTLPYLSSIRTAYHWTRIKSTPQRHPSCLKFCLRTEWRASAYRLAF